MTSSLIPGDPFYRFDHNLSDFINSLKIISSTADRNLIRPGEIDFLLIEKLKSGISTKVSINDYQYRLENNITKVKKGFLYKRNLIKIDLDKNLHKDILEKPNITHTPDYYVYIGLNLKGKKAFNLINKGYVVNSKSLLVDKRKTISNFLSMLQQGAVPKKYIQLLDSIELEGIDDIRTKVTFFKLGSTEVDGVLYNKIFVKDKKVKKLIEKYTDQ